jgi:hypothetical protein
MSGLMLQRLGLAIVNTECSVTTVRVYLNVKRVFGQIIENSDGKKVYVRYIGEQHVKEDCNGYIPSAKEWVDNINKPTEWMIKTLKIED